MYRKVSTDLNFIPREEEVLQFWKEKQIFQKSMEKNKGKEPFTFYDGPPTANGKPHIGHILTRCIKDLIPRYYSMKGYDVLRKAGWDTHGLPVELEVEKQLDLDGKEQIEEYGVEKFIEACKQSVWTYRSEWERMSERVGFWADMEHPYVTYEDNYIESEWWALKKIFDSGLLYKGHKTVPYCPRCGTALSSHEVAQGYKDVEETSVIVRFACKNEDASFLAWTTTPWTLPSNCALCVNPREKYCRVRSNGETFIMAEALVESVLGESAEILGRIKGQELVGQEYEPLFDFTKKHANGCKGWYVTPGDYVTLSDGTGIVHIAPAFGEDDSQIGKKFSLPFIQLVDSAGNMCGGTPWDGMFVKDADPLIIKNLQENGQLFRELDYAHSYPFCWRCDTPLIYYARSSWFIEMTAVKEKLAEFNRRANWIPENIKEGRMGNFIDNVVDWGISRERYWGTPLPVWVCNECNHAHAIGSKEELRKMGKDVPEDIELHKPYIDRIHLICEECGGDMQRVPEVIDCWFDSGAMPFAQWHYPFENQDVFAKRYPANFISEAVDQTRGWFYTLLAISTLLMEEPAFENCLVLGHVQDQEGRKMSKHLGNVVDPWSVLDKQGADAVRWYFYTSSMPWLPSRFGPDNVSEMQRKFMGTFWNTYAFYVLYAEIDQFDPSKYELRRENLSKMDLWVLSRLYSTVAFVDDSLSRIRITEAARALQEFVDELSNWYIRRCRERYWGKEMTEDKEAAYMTLFTVLETLTRAAAPFVPFMTENIYCNVVAPFFLDRPESVHLADYPAVDTSYINTQMEQNMARVLDIVALGRAVRNSGGWKNRQPLGVMYITGADVLEDEYTAIIAEELNVKRVIFAQDTTEFTTYSIKPQLRTMGPKYGKIINKISEYLKTVDGKVVVNSFKEGKPFEFELEGHRVVMEEADALYELTNKSGFAALSDQNLTVVLDGNLTKELKEEGLVREIISKVQSMRKEAGFDVIDHIVLSHEGNNMIAELLNKYGYQIMEDTLSDRLQEKAQGYIKDWKINGESVTLGVDKI